MDRSAVILAGGQGRRMGGLNKALLRIGEETFIERQLRIVGQWSDEVIVVSNDDHLNAHIRSLSNEIRIVSDDASFHGEGPLAGLYTGLSATTRPYIWLVGCDQPYLDLAAAGWMLERLNKGSHEAVIPLIGGRPQPLHAIYIKDVRFPAEELLKSGQRKLVALLDQLRWVGIEEQQFVEQELSLTFTEDVDTPEQYTRINPSFSEDK